MSRLSYCCNVGNSLWIGEVANMKNESLLQKFGAVQLRLLVCCLAIDFAGTLLADQPAVVTSDALKDLDGHFPMIVPESLPQWTDRADQLRLQLGVALGVHPRPALAIVKPVVHGRRELDGYSIEKIYFESLPGFYVTASLYRPLSESTPNSGCPAVLYAHGHWEKGRFYQAGPKEVRQLLASGAERFENAAINQMQAACVQLARMGCVVLQYDMIGYADSGQISFDRAHLYGISVTNPVEESDGWLLYSAKAEGYDQSILSLQTINGLQAFEVLRSLPDVDPKRIAITGASGGGTQSFLAAAMEPRLAGAFPAVMVSTGMQGGCTCENACGLRIGTGNVEIAALTAPRPLGMTTAQDWTLTMPTDGFPELQQLYSLFGKKSAVELFPGPQFPHNYNHVSRVAMYGWMNRLFDLRLTEPILERDFELLGQEQLTVWDDSHARPAAGLDYERQLTSQWAATIDASLRSNDSDDAATTATKHRLLREGWQTITAPAMELDKSSVVSKTGDRISLVSDIETSSKSISFLEHQSAAGSKVAFSFQLFDPLGGDDKQQPLVKNPRLAAAYTYGYNAPRIVRKLGVLLRLIEAAQQERKLPMTLIVSPNDSFVAIAATLHLPAGTIEKVRILGTRAEVLDKFTNVDNITDNDFLPGSLRYQGIAGLLMVVEPELVEFSL